MSIKTYVLTTPISTPAPTPTREPYLFYWSLTFPFLILLKRSVCECVYIALRIIWELLGMKWESKFLISAFLVVVKRSVYVLNIIWELLEMKLESKFLISAFDEVYLDFLTRNQKSEIRDLLETGYNLRFATPSIIYSKERFLVKSFWLLCKRSLKGWVISNGGKARLQLYFSPSSAVVQLYFTVLQIFFWTRWSLAFSPLTQTQ